MTGNSTEVDNKLESLIDEFRDAHPESVEMAYMGFSKPCQLELFSIENPLHFSILVITHDDNREDENVITHNLRNGSDLLDKMDKVLESPRWKQAIDSEYVIPDGYDLATRTSSELATRRDLIEGCLQQFFNNIGSEIILSDYQGLTRGTRLTKKMWVYFIRGDIREISSEDLMLIAPLEDGDGESIEDEEDEDGESIEDEEDEDGESIEDEEDDDIKSSTEEEYSPISGGYGTYFYKGIWVGEIPDLEFESRIKSNLEYERETVITREFEEFTIAITQDGFISIDGVDEKRTALKVLNIIFGCSMFHGLSFHAATENDLINVNFDEDYNIDKMSGMPSLARQVAKVEPNQERMQQEINPRRAAKRDIVEIETIEEILNDAETVTSKEELGERISFALQAYTHHQNGEYAQAFLLSWISIEQYINTHLNYYLKDKMDVNRSRRDKITDSPNWTSTHKIEILEISDAITDEEYTMMDEFRSKRNKIVHEMESVSEESSRKVLELSFNILYESFNDRDQIRSIDIF